MAEIDVLILCNLKDLDGAAARLRNEIQKQVGLAVNSIVRDWAEKEGWKGVFDWYGDEDIVWIADPSWRGEDEEDEDDYEFWFRLEASEGRDFENDPNGDQFWLTSLCSAGRSTLGFRSCQDAYKYPKGRKWKAKIEPFVQEFIKLGFTYDNANGQVFLPIAVDQERLARALENEDVREALEPVIATLDRLIQARPVIDQLRAIAKIPQ